MAEPSPAKLSLAVKAEARRLGFDHCRITPLGEAPHANFFDGWLQQGRAGEMTYLERNREKRRHPVLLVEASASQPRSLIVLAVNHYQFDLPPGLRDDPSRGLIASYAWGDDYHEIVRPALHALDGFIRTRTGRRTPGKCLVDTGPVLERDWAQVAGLGFFGKNCCTIRPGEGSWLLLATILTDDRFAYDPPIDEQTTRQVAPTDVLDGLVWDESVATWQLATEDGRTVTGTCGRCTRCLQACPTDAFIGPFHLDPQRCISYWTIESRQPIPVELRPHFGNRIFGCDICQEVCPWNRRLAPRSPLMAGLAAQSDRVAIALLEGFDPQTPYWLEPAAFSARFRGSPIKRAKRRGMLRNVCVSLGNWADAQAVAALQRALADPEALGRGHAAWALGQVLQRHGDERAFDALSTAKLKEQDDWVRGEIAAALGGSLTTD